MQEKQPLILTLRPDDASQAFFDGQRKLYFPPERNFLNAHLTLFHQLPDEPATYNYLASLQHVQFALQITGLMSLGAGVAYRVDSPDLQVLHRQLRAHFAADLIPQDRQSFRPHITIQNKTAPEKANALFVQLSENFRPFSINATGLDLWTYLDGPWRHEQTFLFDGAV